MEWHWQEWNQWGEHYTLHYVASATALRTMNQNLENGFWMRCQSSPQKPLYVNDSSGNHWIQTDAWSKGNQKSFCSLLPKHIANDWCYVSGSNLGLSEWNMTLSSRWISRGSRVRKLNGPINKLRSCSAVLTDLSITRVTKSVVTVVPSIEFHLGWCEVSM